MYKYIIFGAAITVITSYFLIGAAFCGFPHKCPKHGWCSSGICLTCEYEYEYASMKPKTD